MTNDWKKKGYEVHLNPSDRGGDFTKFPTLTAARKEAKARAKKIPISYNGRRRVAYIFAWYPGDPNAIHPYPSGWSAIEEVSAEPKKRKVQKK